MPTTTVEPIVRAYIARVDDINPRDRSMVATINTAALDRYRTVIDPKGIDVAAYRENPVVLWEHGRDGERGSMPIGRNDWVRSIVGPDGPMMRARTLFHGGKKDPDGYCQRLFECYRDGDMRAWSVNVVPRAEGCSPPTKDEIRARPELVDCWMMYRSSDLAEYSAVAVGGNAEALTADEGRSILRCVSRGLTLPAALVERAQEAVDEEHEVRKIVEEDGKFYVKSEDGKKDLGGPYATKEEAEKRLREVEYFKHKDERSVTPPEPELPPLGGRPFAARRAEVLSQLGGLFDEARADLEMRADFRRGRV